MSNIPDYRQVDRGKFRLLFKQLRKAHKISHEKLAASAKVSRTYISRIENLGVTPKAKTFKRIISKIPLTVGERSKLLWAYMAASWSNLRDSMEKQFDNKIEKEYWGEFKIVKSSDESRDIRYVEQIKKK